MAHIDEDHSARFIEWERRARGLDVFPHPVAPEPPFTPFRRPAPSTPTDDGRRPTVLSSLVRAISRGLANKPRMPDARPDDDEPEAEEPPPIHERGELAELPLFLPPGFSAKGSEFAQFVEGLSACDGPVAFEVVGTAASVTAQLAVNAEDEPHVRAQLRAFFPDLATAPASGGLASAWEGAGGFAGAVEFGLARETMLPLASFGGDLCVPLVGALADLRPGECGVFQVIFQPVSHPWADSLVRSVSDGGGAFFVNAPELHAGARQKASRPLFGAVVRIATRGDSIDRVWDVAKGMASALRVLASIGGNELIPLRNDGYPFGEHMADVTLRQSRRAGMLLNSDELFGLIRFPTAAVRSAKFLRQARKTKAAPEIATGAEGVLLGTNDHAGETREVRLTAEQRTRHLHLVGASGTGKSTLFLNMIRQDIEGGQGLAVLDPHGDLIDRILGAIPPERVADVVLLDPADEDFVVGFNVLAAHSDWERNLLASDLVAVFRRLSTSWGDQMNSVFGKAILAFLESERGGTLADLRRFLLEPAYRDEFLRTVRDPDVVYYWRKGFAQLSGNKSVGPILTRLETFLSPKPIRRMVSQAGSSLDFSRMMDEGKIFLGRLSQGAIGRENAHLLGSLLVSKFQQAAMGRQRQAAGARRDFWLYADEFPDLITPSMAEILTGARKYRLGLTLAHQELRQLRKEPDVESAVMANCFTRVVFRVSDDDARALERGFSHFEARDLQGLATGQAVARVERSDCDFNLSVPQLDYPDEAEAAARREEVRAASHARYATPRAEVDAAALARAREAEGAGEAAPRATKAAARKPGERRPPDDEPPPPAPVTPPDPIPPPPAPSAVSPSPPTPVSRPTARPAASEPDPVAPDPPGRGGFQHNAIVRRIREAAEALGFHAEKEKTLARVPGSADLALSRPGLSIGCEVTVTTTIDHEVGNVAKCLKEGFDLVAVVCGSAAKRERLRAAVADSLGAGAAPRIGYFSPDEFLAYLRALPPPPVPEAPGPARPTVRRIGKYKVKTTYATLAPEEAAAREAEAIRQIAAAMRAPRK